MGLAEEMHAECVAVGQSARRVAAPADRRDLRADLRRLARASAVRIRTAERDDVVLVARLDAAVWKDDTATMQVKLTPPAGPPVSARP